jgi:hypothetical protein
MLPFPRPKTPIWKLTARRHNKKKARPTPVIEPTPASSGLLAPGEAPRDWQSIVTEERRTLEERTLHLRHLRETKNKNRMATG